MKNRIGFISLGCCKNLVDAEHMITLLQKNGFYAELYKSQFAPSA